MKTIDFVDAGGKLIDRRKCVHVPRPGDVVVVKDWRGHDHTLGIPFHSSRLPRDLPLTRGTVLSVELDYVENSVLVVLGHADDES